MKEILIFGRSYTVVEKELNNNSVRIEGNRILVDTRSASMNSLLREFLADLLYSKLVEIYEQIRKERKVEFFGDLDFEVVEKIDGRRKRVAKLKGKRILVKLNAVSLPIDALKYVVAHEIAHIFTKKHTKRFWKIVEAIYPNFRVGEKLLNEYEEILTKPLLS